MKRVSLVVAAGSGLFAADGAFAASTTVGGMIDLHAGYGSNPFFDLNSLGGTETVGTSVSAKIDRTTAVSRSELTGEADIDQYIKHYGGIKNYSARLRHNQQLSHAVSISADVAYLNSINQNPSFSTSPSNLGPLGDLLTVGQRTQRISGGLDLTYEPNDRNLFQLGVNGSHATFSGGTANSYDQYGVSFGYLRTVSSRTKIGFQGGVNEIVQTGQPHAQSYSGGLQLVQQLTARWHLEAGATLLAQTSYGHLSKTPGFNLSLCGKYTRKTICFLGSRQSAPSGLGGLRTDTQGGVRVNYEVSSRTSVEASATYDVSTSTGNSPIPAQKYYDGALSFHREISRRIYAGASLRAQRRDYGTLFSPTGSKVNAYTATMNVAWKFGRIS